METGLTLEKALEYQENDLKTWGNVLNSTTYEKLVRIIKTKNKGITNPYQICRGNDIDTIVRNLSMGNDYLYDEGGIYNVHVVVEIDTKKDFETIKKSLTRGIYRSLDSGPEHVAQPKDVKILSIYTESFIRKNDCVRDSRGNIVG
jgi:hypothetical protein